MASANRSHNECSLSPLIRLPAEIRHCIYCFLIPHVIQLRSSLIAVYQKEVERRSLIALFLINKQLSEEISYTLFQYSHFIISIDWCRFGSVFLCMSVKLASSVKHIDISLEWMVPPVARPISVSTTRYRYAQYSVEVFKRLKFLEELCVHLRAFRCLQTLTVDWNKNGDLNARPTVGQAVSTLQSLERLQMELPRVQISIQAIPLRVDPESEIAVIKSWKYTSSCKSTCRSLGKIRIIQV